MKYLLHNMLVCGSLLLASAAIQAQEGHPLKGSWIGTWEGNQVVGRSLLVILDWDGDEISGMINPGTHNMTIADASLDPDGWAVTLHTVYEKEGQRNEYTLEGQIENIEQASRSVTGTWTDGQTTGRFEMTRQ